MTDAMLEEQQKSFEHGINRAEVVKRLEEELFEIYSNPELSEKPKPLEQRGGAFYSEASGTGPSPAGPFGRGGYRYAG